MAIELHRITPDNHDAVRALAVRADQAHLVATVDRSLADAYVWQAAEFRAAFHEGAPIGYVTIFPFERNGRQIVNVVRLMVDARHQGQGLGRATLAATLDWIRTLTPAPDLIRISTLPENEVALRLYTSMGFVAEGTEDGETALYRKAD